MFESMKFYIIHYFQFLNPYMIFNEIFIVFLSIWIMILKNLKYIQDNKQLQDTFRNKIAQL